MTARISIEQPAMPRRRELEYRSSVNGQTQGPQLALPQATNQPLSCIICTCELPDVTLHASCREHHMCEACIRSAFRLANAEREHYPPRCCQSSESLLHVSRQEIRDILGHRLFWKFVEKRAEYSIRPSHRLYCSNPQCAGFTGRRDLLQDNGINRTRICPHCENLTCSQCLKNIELGSPHECRRTTTDTDFRAFANSLGYQACRECGATIELRDACNHVRCRCGAQFCYVCGMSWTGYHGCPMYGQPRYDAEGYNQDGFHRDSGLDRQGLQRGGVVPRTRESALRQLQSNRADTNGHFPISAVRHETGPESEMASARERLRRALMSYETTNSVATNAIRQLERRYRGRTQSLSRENARLNAENEAPYQQASSSQMQVVRAQQYPSTPRPQVRSIVNPNHVRNQTGSVAQAPISSVASGYRRNAQAFPADFRAENYSMAAPIAPPNNSGIGTNFFFRSNGQWAVHPASQRLMLDQRQQIWNSRFAIGQQPLAPALTVGDFSGMSLSPHQTGPSTMTGNQYPQLDGHGFASRNASFGRSHETSNGLNASTQRSLIPHHMNYQGYMIPMSNSSPVGDSRLLPAQHPAGGPYDMFRAPRPNYFPTEGNRVNASPLYPTTYSQSQ